MLKFWTKHSPKIVEGAIISLIVSAVGGLVIWYASYHGLAATVSIFCDDIKSLTKEVRGLSNEFGNYRLDALRDKGEIKEEIHKVKEIAEDATERVGKIEKRVNKLHQDFYDHKISKGHNQ